MGCDQARPGLPDCERDVQAVLGRLKARGESGQGVLGIPVTRCGLSICHSGFLTSGKGHVHSGPQFPGIKSSSAFLWLEEPRPGLQGEGVFHVQCLSPGSATSWPTGFSHNSPVSLLILWNKTKMSFVVVQSLSHV